MEEKLKLTKELNDSLNVIGKAATFRIIQSLDEMFGYREERVIVGFAVQAKEGTPQKVLRIYASAVKSGLYFEVLQHKSEDDIVVVLIPPSDKEAVETVKKLIEKFEASRIQNGNEDKDGLDTFTQPSSGMKYKN